MLNRSASLAMSTSVLKALPGKLDIKTQTWYSVFIAPFIDIPMFNIKCLAMHKVQVHAGAISICLCTGDNPLAKACGLSSCTHAQTINNFYLCNLNRKGDKAKPDG